jgi:methyl-accepting chemotaxis protein
MLTLLLRGFSIRLRMVGAIAMVLVLLAMVGGTGFVGLQRLQSSSDEMSGVLFQSQTSLSELRLRIAQLEARQHDVALAAGVAGQAARPLEQWQQSADAARKGTEQLAASGHPRVQSLAAGVAQKLSSYQGLAQPVLARVAAGALTQPQEAEQALAPAAAELRALDEASAGLASALTSTADTLRAAQQAAGSTALWWFGIAVLLSVVLVVPLTLANMQSICGPIDAATALAQSIAQGDLTRKPLDLRGTDEAAQLLRALQTMQESLALLVGQVRQASQNIHGASAEIATGNQDLSSRTEQAAASLERTAGAVQQLTATVQESAESARQANQLANAASAMASRGGEVVREVVSTMDQINGSSKRIHDIVGVIDSIAFQTNILALNAAVEAARAGEQGRGFAVVASEVRSLAGRSAEAAREIKALIGASVERVDAGTQLVHNAGGTMQEVVTGVQRVSDRMGEIAAAAVEQSNGIGQVNAAVTQLDQMTQQNAALVEQSAAAAQSLQEQAQHLTDVLAAFRTDAAAEPAMARLTPLQAAPARPAARPPAQRPALAVRRAPVRLSASRPPRLPAGPGSAR